MEKLNINFKDYPIIAVPTDEQRSFEYLVSKVGKPRSGEHFEQGEPGQQSAFICDKCGKRTTTWCHIRGNGFYYHRCICDCGKMKLAKSETEEKAKKKNQALERIYQTSGITEGKRNCTFLTIDKNQKSKRFYENLNKCQEFANSYYGPSNNGQGLYVWGDVPEVNTLCIATANELIKRGKTVAISSMPAEFRQLQKWDKNASFQYMKRIEFLESVPCLIIYNFGLSKKWGDTENEDLNMILDYRFRGGKSTIVGSFAPVDYLPGVGIDKTVVLPFLKKIEDWGFEFYG